MTESEQGPLANRLSRRTALRTFGVGVGSAVAAGTVIGHGVAWGGEGFSTNAYPVKPYTLTPGAIETFSITERLHVRIDGFGEDVVQLTGAATFERSAPRLASEAKAAGAALTWATAVHDVTFKTLQAHGTSSVFGSVTVANSGRTTEKGRVQPNARTLSALRSGSPVTANSFGTMGNNCAVQISPTVRLSEYGEELTTGQESVQLGSVVSVVPPVGDVARTLGTVGLYNAAGEKVGTLIAADIAIGPIQHRTGL